MAEPIGKGPHGPHGHNEATEPNPANLSNLSNLLRRDFIKLSALTGAVAAMPAVGMASVCADARNAATGMFRPSPAGRKRTLLFLSDAPERYEALQRKIKALSEYDITVTPVKVNLQTAAALVDPRLIDSADAIVLVMPQVTTSAGSVAAELPPVSSPVIIFPVNFDLIMLEADVAAQFRARGVNALLANSEAHAVEMVRQAMAPRLLEGKKAVIFGRPFDSTSVPARNLDADYVYRYTGVRLQYRPIEELQKRLREVSDEAALKEVERWKKEATAVVEANDRAIIDACRLYVLLRSIAAEEKLAGISIDCLSFSFNNNPVLPYPCLSFTRLRDEGLAAPCEAEVCGMLSSMLLQEISRKPSYFCNVSEVKEEKATVVLRHCVAPVKLMGAAAPALPYRLRDYHGTGRGVTAEIQFPVGVDVSMGGFSKDLREFVLWPGKTVARVRDTDRPSFENAPPGYEKMRRYCSNHLEVKIRDVDSFLQRIAGCHHIMVAGNYHQAVAEALLRMNVRLDGPADWTTTAA